MNNQDLTVLQALLARDRQIASLRTQHLILLGHIVANGRIALSDAALQMDLSISQVSRLARALEDGGYMRRAINSENARRHDVTATAKGRALAERVRTHIETATERTP
jgi:DNA-binding MarR family transcriptional regulator